MRMTRGREKEAVGGKVLKIRTKTGLDDIIARDGRNVRVNDFLGLSAGTSDVLAVRHLRVRCRSDWGGQGKVKMFPSKSHSVFL